MSFFRTAFWLWGIGCCLAIRLGASAAEVCLQQDFEATNCLAQWSGPGMLEDGYRGGRSLAVESQSDGAVVRCALSAAQLKGCAIRVSARVKARGVSSRPNSWNGIKLMLAVETPAGKQWPQAQIDTGTFDWVQISFFTRVPVDATNLHLVMGLERVSGKVWFDDLKVTLVRKWSEPPRAQSLGAVYK